MRAEGAADVSAIAPELTGFLGLAAYLKLVGFEVLSGTVAGTPTFESKEVVSQAAARSLARHQRLVAQLRRHGAVPDDAMHPFREGVDRFHHAARGADWLESLLGVHLVAGLLDDFLLALAAGVRGADEAAAVLAHEPGETELVRLTLAEPIAADHAVASRLALWGRRLTGDAILVARSALRLRSEDDEHHAEQLLADAITAHTRRMDALGLTA